jgi:hypothetical protein
MAGPYDNLIGDLAPNEEGWLPLDVNGTPSGPATHSPPPAPALACSVMANSQEKVDAGEDALLTLAGAPITDHMTSNVDPRSEGTGASTAPSISSINPTTAVQGVDLPLTIFGSRLSGVTDVSVNGVVSAPDSTSGTAVSTTVLGTTLVTGDATVFVTSPDGNSNSLTLTVTATRTNKGPARS